MVSDIEAAIPSQSIGGAASVKALVSAILIRYAAKAKARAHS